jgi:hypothetical protein
MYSSVNFVLGLLYANAARVPPETAGPKTTFRFSPISKTLFRITLLAGVASFLIGTSYKDWGCAVFGLGFVALWIIGCPNIIVADELGLTSTQILRGDRHIRWQDVRSAQFNTGDHHTAIVSTDGTKIHHTGFHCGPKTLHQMIDERSDVTVRYIEVAWSRRREVDRKNAGWR